MDLGSLIVNLEIGLVAFAPGETRPARRGWQEVFDLSKPLSDRKTTRCFFPDLGGKIARLPAPLL